MLLYSVHPVHSGPLTRDTLFLVVVLLKYEGMCSVPAINSSKSTWRLSFGVDRMSGPGPAVDSEWVCLGRLEFQMGKMALSDSRYNPVGSLPLFSHEDRRSESGIR